MVGGAAAIAAATASIAAGATGAQCGTRYTPVCTIPTIHFNINVACHAPGAVIHLAPITLAANAGIKRITVTVHSAGTTVYSASGNGVRRKTVSGVVIRTAGLATGRHSIVITVVDDRGKKVTTTYHFAICRPKPIFTG